MRISTFSIIAATTLLPTVLADDNHGRRPIVTPAALLVKKAETCLAATDTLCPDGLGCCPYGEACTWKSVTIPICAGTCDFPPVYCSGAYSGVCCDAGSSCDYASMGLCTPDTFVFSSFSFSTPSTANPTLTIPSFSYSSFSSPSVPSFTPFFPSSTEDSSSETRSSTSRTTSSSTATSSSTTTTTSSSTTTTAQSNPLVQSTGAAPKEVKVLGGGLLEVVVGGLGLLVGL